MKLFDFDGPLFQAMSTLTNLVVLNILFCICCIPVITIGAASTALHGCVQELLEDKSDTGLIRRYFSIFRKEFKHATGIWLFCLCIFVMLFFYHGAVNILTGTLRQSYQIVFYVFCNVFLLGFQYLSPVQAKYGKNIKFTIKYAWFISVAALPWSLAAIGTTGILIYVSFFINENLLSMALYLWILAGFSFVAYMQNIFYLKAFKYRNI